MKRTRRTVLALIAAVAALTLLPSVAAAGARPNRVVRMPSAMSTVQYRAASQLQMRNNVARIQSKLYGVRMMPLRMRSNMMLNVNEGVRLINQRIDYYGRDGKITAMEQQHIRLLANAISSDLRRSYNNFDTFMLL